MLESKFDIWMFCVHILYNVFQLFMRIKSEKNIINIPPINVTTKSLQAIRKPLFSKLQRNVLGKVGPKGNTI